MASKRTKKKTRTKGEGLLQRQRQLAQLPARELAERLVRMQQNLRAQRDKAPAIGIDIEDSGDVIVRLSGRFLDQLIERAAADAARRSRAGA